MPGANHCPDSLFPLFWITPFRLGERAEVTFSRKTKRGIHCFQLGMVTSRYAILLLDSRHAKRFEDPSLSVTSKRERPRSAKRISRVIDVTLLCETGSNRVEIGLTSTAPAPLPHLSSKVVAQLRSRRREASDIAQCKLVQLALIKRRQCPSRSRLCHDAVFVPQSLTIRKPARPLLAIRVEK